LHGESGVLAARVYARLQAESGALTGRV